MDKLHSEIRENRKEYQNILDILKIISSVNHGELFRLKRKPIMISREKTELIEECNNISL